MSRYAFIATRTERWPVQFLSRVLAVSAVGYYQWRQKSAAVPAPWQAAAQAAFTRHARRYWHPVESGWSTLKTEFLPHGTALASLEDARLKGAYYLETCFNRHRRHAALGRAR
jgi:hypothetical protein